MTLSQQGLDNAIAEAATGNSLWGYKLNLNDVAAVHNEYLTILQYLYDPINTQGMTPSDQSLDRAFNRVMNNGYSFNNITVTPNPLAVQFLKDLRNQRLYTKVQNAALATWRTATESARSVAHVVATHPLASLAALVSITGACYWRFLNTANDELVSE